MSSASDLFKEIEQELESSYTEDTGKEEKKEVEYVDISTKKKAKKPLSEVAKKARIANLEKGRLLRKQKILERKRLEQMYSAGGYADEDEDDSDEDEEKFKPKLPQRKQKGGAKVQRLALEVEAMKNIVSKLSKKKEKQNKVPVIINNHPAQPQQNDDNITGLLKSKILKF